MNLYETIQEDGYDIKIYIDENPESPRQWDNFGKMICFHNRYTLGDEHKYSDPEEFLMEIAGLSEEQAQKLYYKANESHNDYIDLLIQKASKSNVILPLYLYDHSGISMSCSDTYPYNDRWDAGMVGFIYIPYEDIRKEFDSKRVTKKLKEQAVHNLKGEVDVYDDYLRGDVYGYEVEYDGESIGSVWGYYGDEHEKSGLLESARGDISADQTDRRKKHSEKLKSYIMNRVPLMYREPANF